MGKMKFMNVSISDIMNKYVGQSEKLMQVSKKLSNNELIIHIYI